jgi:apolipoprotein N-acyltransferase
MTGRLDYNEYGMLRAAVPITAGDQTFYNRYGDWFAGAALWSLVLTLLAVGTGFLASIRKRKDNAGQQPRSHG